MSHNNSGSSGSILMKLFQSTCRGAGVITRVQFSEDPPPKICEGEKNFQNSAQCFTTFDFHREYLRNGSSRRKSENTTINYNPFHVGPKNLVNFGPQTFSVCGVGSRGVARGRGYIGIYTLPKSVQVNFLWDKNDVKTVIQYEY